MKRWTAFHTLPGKRGRTFTHSASISRTQRPLLSRMPPTRRSRSIQTVQWQKTEAPTHQGVHQSVRQESSIRRHRSRESTTVRGTEPRPSHPKLARKHPNVDLVVKYRSGVRFIGVGYEKGPIRAPQCGTRVADGAIWSQSSIALKGAPLKAAVPIEPQDATPPQPPAHP